jgi:uncharacterized SAM-binding protein YcdF (DUF218 family)
MPPVPFLLLTLAGITMLRRRARRGTAAALVGLAGTWFSLTVGGGEWLQAVGMPRTPAFDVNQRALLQQQAAAGTPVAVIVLGGGREALAPEYGMPSLRPLTMERLRYGIWLARQTGAPAGFTGGVGHGAASGPTEADIAARIAAEELGQPLRWTENRSRDTRENGRFMVELLKREGIRKAVLVTHTLHMARSLRAFRDAAAQAGIDLELVPAPVGLAARSETRLARWMPSEEGLLINRYFWHEKLGWWAGA